MISNIKFILCFSKKAHAEIKSSLSKAIYKAFELSPKEIDFKGKWSSVYQLSIMELQEHLKNSKETYIDLEHYFNSFLYDRYTNVDYQNEILSLLNYELYDKTLPITLELLLKKLNSNGKSIQAKDWVDNTTYDLGTELEIHKNILQLRTGEYFFYVYENKNQNMNVKIARTL